MKFVSRLFAASVIEIREGNARGLKGKFNSRLINEISSLAKELGISDGEIWLGPLGQVGFSKDIPGEFHQRFRNVIASVC